MAVEPNGPTIVVVYPELMGTYGDGGNAIALRARLTRRGLDARVIAIHAPDPVPRSADLYLIGGAENASQTTAARLLKSEGGLAAAVERGASVVGICGGYQVLGESITDADGVTTDGLGLLDVRSGPLAARAVGDLAITASGLDAGLPDLVGFENHAYGTVLGPDAEPLGAVIGGSGGSGRGRGGVGNGLTSRADQHGQQHKRFEGAVRRGTGGAGSPGSGSAGGGIVLGTYLHGPLLALNPALADHLLTPFVGFLEPLDDSLAAEVREVRVRTLQSR